MTDKPPVENEDVGLQITKYDFQLKREAQQMGKVGELFGSRENAALYIAGTVVLSAMLGLGIIAIFEPATRPDLVKVLGAMAIATMGYIGGLLSGGK